MSKSIVNINDVEPQPLPPLLQPKGRTAENYQSKTAFISRAIGATKLGYNVTTLAPGKRAFPLHNHHVNEEMFFVLSGRGEIRIGEEVFDIKKDDVIACPPGGVASAHQITNTGDEELKYLAVSTTESPELVEYPNSEKFAVIAYNLDGREQPFRYVGREQDSRDYWDGE